jgi:hypothetical protein
VILQKNIVSLAVSKAYNYLPAMPQLIFFGLACHVAAGYSLGHMPVGTNSKDFLAITFSEVGVLER